MVTPKEECFLSSAGRNKTSSCIVKFTGITLVDCLSYITWSWVGGRKSKF